MVAATRRCLTLALCVTLVALLSPPVGAQEAEQPANLFQNPGFESGPAPWGTSVASGTVAEFKVSDEEAAEGEHSVLVKIRTAAGWGYQFGQGVAAGQKGKTYTFAVLAKSVGGPAVVQLEIERRGGDYDRATRSGPTLLREGGWQEVHTTFTVTDDFPEGWFAYVSCTQTGARFRLDAFRLYEGEYVPHDKRGEAAAEEPEGPQNMFTNPGFELGTAAWNASRAPDTDVDFQVVDDMAAEGEHSALIELGASSGWGLQFGQRFPAGRKGKTYTFAALGRSVGGPVSVQLEIERPADPWDRAARGQPTTLTEDKWTELHTTFTVTDDFPEGWSAFVSCTQPNAWFHLDAFRLYEGEYVPHGQEVKVITLPAAPIEEPEPEPQAAGPVIEPLPPTVRLFDTREPVAGPLAADAPAHLDRWTEVPAGQAEHAFGGDAVLLNNRIALAMRKGSAGAEVYSVGEHGLKLRAVLAPVASEATTELSSVGIRSNGADAAVVDVAFATEAGGQVGIGCELRVGQPFVRTTPGEGVHALRIEAPCRFGVLPDFFADDIVLDATRLGADRAELPSENFFLHMLPDRNAIVAAVWNSRDEDIRIELSGDGADRVMTASQVAYGEQEGHVSVAVLEGRRVWHVHGVAAADAGQVVSLNWKAPFIAHWRVDWTRHDGLTDSWAMVVAREGGSYRKPSFAGYEGGVPKNRQRWTTVLGSFQYPCWLEADGQGYLEPMGGVLRFVGPALIYPINRVRETPLDVYTVTDVVRETLGVGPCEYILDLEGQRTVRYGVATCPTRDRLDAIYGEGRQTERRADVEKALEDVITFIRYIRGRIRHYQDFGHEVLAYLAEQKQAHPELAQRIAELEKLARAIDDHVAARAVMIKTPEYAAELADQFRATLLGYEGEDALAKCKAFTAAWVEIGGNQDNLVGECRWAVKVLRQRAGLIMAEDPRMGEIAREVRSRSQEAMRNPASYESPRH